MRWSVGATELREDLGGDQLQVIEVVQVEDLQVDTARTESSEAADLVDDLVRRAGQGSSA